MRQAVLVHPELSYKLNGIFFAVHNELGRFRNEQQYCDAIEAYLKLYGIPYEREKVLPLSFPGEQAGRNKVDFLIAVKIVVEVKVRRVIERADYYQTKRYLVTLGKKLALLVNFREKFLRPKRILNASAAE